MNLQGQRDLQLLNELECDSDVTQRSLAKKLGVALGLTNLYLKRLTRKGFLKITTVPRNRIKYFLTPRGIAEKSRLTYQYMRYSLTYYRHMRERLKRILSEVSNSGAKRVVIYGTGELAELAYLSLCEIELMFVGFVSRDPGFTFLSHPVRAVESLSNMDFDAILIADLENSGHIRAQLVCGAVPEEKIIPLVPSGEF